MSLEVNRLSPTTVCVEEDGCSYCLFFLDPYATIILKEPHARERSRTVAITQTTFRRLSSEPRRIPAFARNHLPSLTPMGT